MKTEQTVTAPVKSLDKNKPCPFAALCAIAGFYVAPPLITTIIIPHLSKIEPIEIDALFIGSLALQPPARPPRA